MRFCSDSCYWTLWSFTTLKNHALRGTTVPNRHFKDTIMRKSEKVQHVWQEIDRDEKPRCSSTCTGWFMVGGPIGDFSKWFSKPLTERTLKNRRETQFNWNFKGLSLKGFESSKPISMHFESKRFQRLVKPGPVCTTECYTGYTGCFSMNQDQVEFSNKLSQSVQNSIKLRRHAK